MPKVKRGVRDIPVHRKKLLPILMDYMERHAGDQRVFVNPRSGAPWTEGAWQNQVKRDIESVGLVYGQKKPDGITPHTFRHTVPSWMAERDTQ